VVDGDQIVNYVFGDHWLPDNPEASRWVSTWDQWEYEYSRPIPGSIISRAGTGIPLLWQEVQDRVTRNEPGPITSVAGYDNPIYASESTILQRYSGSIDIYQTQGLLPDPTYNFYNFYRVNLASFIGPSDLGPIVWNRQIEYLNSAFSMELRGDLRLVVVTDPVANLNWADYDLALTAYWEDPNLWGDNPISPSTLMVVLHSSDGITIDHVFADTGAPSGNDYLIERLKTQLIGQVLEPSTIVGDVHGTISAGTVIYEHENPGIIEGAVFGLSDPATKFEYVDVNSAFSYLIRDIKPTSKQAVWIVIFTVLFGSIGWVIAYSVGEREWQRGSNFFSQGSRYRRSHW